MRTLLAGLGVLVAACSSEAGNQASPSQPATPQEDGSIECAIGPDAAWSDDCLIERSGEALTIRHPDGGFRRFRVLADGRGVEAADGAEVARLQIVDRGRVEIRIGGDRYRLPVRIAGQAP